MKATSIIITPFEEVVLSKAATTAINKLKGSEYDKRTEKGKAVDRLVETITAMSEESYNLGINIKELLK